MNDVTTAPAPAKKPSAFLSETVTWVQHWTDELFSFRTTRDPAFRFQSGQFVMVGLEVDGKPLLRAYSIASPSWHDELEFYSIKVADGPLTSRLQKIQVGDQVLLVADRQEADRAGPPLEPLDELGSRRLDRHHHVGATDGVRAHHGPGLGVLLVGEQRRAAGVRLDAIAAAAGYASVAAAVTDEDVAACMVTALTTDGPHFILVKVTPEQADVPRIAHTPAEIRDRFRASLAA